MNLVRMNRQNLISLHGVLDMLDAKERFEVGHASGAGRKFGEDLLKKTVCGDESGRCFPPVHLLAGPAQHRGAPFPRLAVLCGGGKRGALAARIYEGCAKGGNKS